MFCGTANRRPILGQIYNLHTYEMILIKSVHRRMTELLTQSRTPSN